MNSIFTQGLAVAVILLFIGIAIQPSVADANISDSEDDCDICQKLSSLNFIRMKSLFDILETHDDRLSVISNINPKAAEKYSEVSYKISELNQVLKTDKYKVDNGNETICNFLEPLWWTLAIRAIILFNMADSLMYSNSILFIIPLFIAWFYYARLLILTVFVEKFGCELLFYPYLSQKNLPLL